jgi:hypothetical protein
MVVQLDIAVQCRRWRSGLVHVGLINSFNIVMEWKSDCSGLGRSLVMVEPKPYSWSVTIVSLSGLESDKQTTEVSENRTPEACSLIQVSARIRRMTVTLPSGTTSV